MDPDFIVQTTNVDGGVERNNARILCVNMELLSDSIAGATLNPCISLIDSNKHNCDVNIQMNFHSAFQLVLVLYNFNKATSLRKQCSKCWLWGLTFFDCSLMNWYQRLASRNAHESIKYNFPSPLSLLSPPFSSDPALRARWAYNRPGDIYLKVPDSFPHSNELVIKREHNYWILNKCVIDSFV